MGGENMNTELYLEVDQYFNDSNVQGAVTDLESKLAQQPTDRFKSLIGRQFTNTPESIATALNQFVTFCQSSFEIKAIYLEMNGFDINYDRWYFDTFGYAEYFTDPDDLEWLCDWSSGDWEQVTLTGLELVQNDFEWYHENEICEQENYTAAYDIAVQLVMAKFVQLVESAIQTDKFTAGIPVLATAHDFETIGRFEP
jgi:hypothetical protein